MNTAHRVALTGLALLVLTRAPLAMADNERYYTFVCGTSTTVCTPNDVLKITAKEEAGWTATTVTISHRDATQAAKDNAADKDAAKPVTLDKPLFEVEATLANTDRVINLRPLIAATNRSRPEVLQTLYRRPSPQVPLQLNINNATHHETVPFILDLTSAYRDGTLGLMPGAEGPWCSEKEGQERPSQSAGADCQFGSVLTLPVENLSQWETATTHEDRNLLLYLNGVAMTGLSALTAARTDQPDKPQSVSFRLTRDLAVADQAKAWSALLATSADVSMGVSVGIGTDAARWSFTGHTTTLALPRQPFRPVLIGLAAFVVLIILRWCFGSALRGFSGTPKARQAFCTLATAKQDVLKPRKITTSTFAGPYSLSLLLMASWLLLVSFSFFSMWLATHSPDLVNSTALSLLGFGAGAAVFARAAEAATDSDRQLDDKLAAALTAFDGVTFTDVEAALKDARLAGLISSGSTWKDLLSEKGVLRVDLHRVQLLLFSVFYMGVFLWSLNNILALPDFSTATLGLLGISTASYLGFKFASAQ